MNKYEIIFIIIAIIAYIICAFTLNVPQEMHIMVGALLVVALIIAILLIAKSNYENEKISRIFRILSIIMLIFYIITTISELWYHTKLIFDSGIFLVLFIILIISEWFFKKNSD
jgi:cytochrome c biogenesis factor